ncbi:MAG: response regulator [Deltaproteobacteria bacterium]|nr:response regulator [Deltaproteobacteria bacterium]
MTHKILVVDDNARSRTLFSEVLTSDSYEVIEACNGEEGLKAAKEHNPALILMDIQMPVMDGLACLKLIREDMEIGHVKIVALTSFAMKGDREKFMAAGFDGYITKPIDIDQLTESVNGFIGTREG